MGFGRRGGGAPATWVGAALLLLPLGCGEPGAEGDDPLAWAFDEAGPYRVGYRTWEIAYVPPGSTEDRTIAVHLWYPTNDESGFSPTYEFMFPDDQAFEYAAPAAPVHEGGYPVLAYSHGNQGFGGSSSFLMRHFASHGWLAVAPDHSGNTLSTHQEPRPLSLWLDRSSDLSAALDSLASGNDNASQPSALSGPARTDRVVLAGHSFGGYTVWATAGAVFDGSAIAQRCDEGVYPDDQCTDALLDAFGSGGADPRVVAGIPMAGAGREDWFGDEGLNAVVVPMLQMSGSLDAGAVDGTWDLASGVEMTWVDIEGGCHQLFALGTCDEVPSDEGFAIVNTYALALARHLVLGDSGAGTLGVLDGSIAVSPRVTFLHR